MKITLRQLQKIIREVAGEEKSKKPAKVISVGNEKALGRIIELKREWDGLDLSNPPKDKKTGKPRPEAHKNAKKFLRKLWDSTGFSWAKPYGTGGDQDPAGPAWSAATISYVVDDKRVKSIRHSDYMKDAVKRRKKWDKGEDLEFVAFYPGEVALKPGDIRCYDRKGGQHCDIYIGNGQLIGGNVGDTLKQRSVSEAPKKGLMYIIKNPKRLTKNT